MDRPAATVERTPSRVMAGLRLATLGVVAAAIVVPLTSVVAGISKKLVALAVLALALAPIGWLTRRPRDLLLFSWVVSLTYNRQFWSFDALFGDHGSFGPYWMVSDILLVLLLIVWVFELTVLGRRPRAEGASTLPWYLPFAVVAALSIIGAAEPAWSLGDMARLVKLGLVLLYFRYNVGPRQWWLIVAALSVALCVQSALGILEVASGRTGVLWLFGVGGPDYKAQLGITTLFGGWTRATGTMGHPPYLATFMLLVIPIVMSLALTLRGGLALLAAVAASLLGLVGLACTLSRLPIAIAAGQTALLVVALVGLRELRITRAIGIVALMLFVVSVIAIALSDRISDRVTRDLRESLDHRVADYRVSIKMLSDHPFLGVGLNNFGAHMDEYGSTMAWGIAPKWQKAATDIVHMRILAGPLNGFLYVATVTGVLGLFAFIFYALGALLLAVRATLASSGPRRAACAGMFVGIVGMYLEQALDYSIWIDPVIATWVILVGLCARAAVVWEEDSTRAPVIR